MSFLFLRGEGEEAKERARWMPGASALGARFIFSMHRLQAATSVFPVRTFHTDLHGATKFAFAHQLLLHRYAL